MRFRAAHAKLGTKNGVSVLAMLGGERWKGQTGETGKHQGERGKATNAVNAVLE